MTRLALLGIAALLVAACQDDRVAGPSASGSAASVEDLQMTREPGGGGNLPAFGARGLRVMTYNLYLGTDLGPIMSASDPQSFLAAAGRAYAELQQTDFPARAGRIADQIARVRPDVLGIEEVALWSVSAPFDPTGDGSPSAPFVVQYDFLTILLKALRARGLEYVAAAADTTSDVTAPAPTAFDASGNPAAFALVRFQDRDAVLVRAGVAYRDPRHTVYQTYLPLDMLGTPTGISNGWSSVRATVGGQTFRFVATHLNAEDGPVNAAQAQELLAALRNETLPVVLVGDFNSGPGVTGEFAGTYGLLTGGGFRDLWPLAHPSAPGLTNGPQDGVGSLNAAGVLVPWPRLDFTTRVDLVLLKDALGVPQPVSAAIFGDLPRDRTAKGLWPSDHAAVGMVFSLPERAARR